jgi:two-component system, OmpR family, response regulator
MAKVIPNQMRVLLVEDDVDVAESVRRALAARGIGMELSTDGFSALQRVAAGGFDVIVADRMMPRMSGLEFVKAARARGDSTPVLFLTALGGLNDRVEGLEAGGDDYLVKPFEHAELVARLRALVRRTKGEGAPTTLRIGDLEIDLIRHTATRAGTPLELQAKEFRLLATLAQHEGRVLTKTMLLERVWGFHFDPRTSVVETHISRLRAKVDRPFAETLIHTVRGAGYCLHAGEPDSLQ